MIQKSTTLIFILFCLSSFSQEIINKKIVSHSLQTKRDLKIYIPEGYTNDSLKRYPLTVVFDAEYLFDVYVGNAVLFAEKDRAPKQIIVGISMEQTRKQDTYFNVELGTLTPKNRAFYNFIKNELLFYMESNYRTSPFISLVGTGTSANLITHFLQEDKPYINSYICINPTFSDLIGNQLQDYNLSRFLKEDNTFYFYINNSTSFSSKKQTQIDELQKGLSSLELKNFNIINDNIDTSTSISAMSEAIPRALSSVFEIYSGISKDEFDKSIKDLSPKDAISYLENKYIEIEYLFGSNLGIRENDIYAIESIIIEKENGNYLKKFGKMILKLFPTSPLGDYYIGRYYENKKSLEKAIEHYKIGYGKMDPSDPNIDAFYENILRVGGK